MDRLYQTPTGAVAGNIFSLAALDLDDTTVSIDRLIAKIRRRKPRHPPRIKRTDGWRHVR
jgi:hypothetical protein